MERREGRKRGDKVDGGQGAGNVGGLEERRGRWCGERGAKAAEEEGHGRAGEGRGEEGRDQGGQGGCGRAGEWREEKGESSEKGERVKNGTGRGEWKERMYPPSTPPSPPNPPAPAITAQPLSTDEEGRP